MKELAALMEGDGFQSVRTYIQSGNVVFQCRAKSPAPLAKRIRGSIEREFGFAPQVIVIDPELLADSIRSNPFPAADQNHKVLHLFFLSEAPDKPDLAGLARYQGKREEFVLRKSVFYLYTPDGFPDSKVQDKIERYLGVHATGRNWRTANQLLEIARTTG